MVRIHQTTKQSTFDIVDKFVEVAFRTNDSLFTPGKKIWSKELREDLYECFINHPIESRESFMEKFGRQMDGAPDDTIQLGAEALYIQTLTPSMMSVAKKVELIETILGWMNNKMTLPDDLKEAYGNGLAMDMSFLQHRYNHVAFLLNVLREWDKFDEQGHSELLENPWAFKKFVHQIECFAAQPFREILCFFVHPNFFEQITSRTHKKMIVKAFEDKIENPTGDADQDIYTIRKALEPKYGEGFSFYHSDLTPKWQPGRDHSWPSFMAWAQAIRDAKEFEAEEIDYKKEIAGNLAAAREALLRNREDWLTLLKKAFGPPNNLTSWRINDNFLSWCGSDPNKARQALREIWEMDPDEKHLQNVLELLPESVVKGKGGRASLMAFLLMGVNVHSHPMYKVEAFKKLYSLADYRKLPPKADEIVQYEYALQFLDQMIESSQEWEQPISSRLEAQGVIWGMLNWSKQGNQAKDWSDEQWEALQTFRDGTITMPVDPDLPDHRSTPLELLADELLLPVEFLQNVKDLLEQKRQVIFFGPPGTGKTFVAQKIAEQIVGEEGEAVLV